MIKGFSSCLYKIILFIFLETQQNIVKRERTLSPKPTAISSTVTEDSAKSQATSVTREIRSLSPFSMPKIQGHEREENRVATDYYSTSNSSNPILKRQTAVVSESRAFSSSSPQAMLEDDENALHGSSEFMLVLYPEDETRERDTFDAMNGEKSQSQKCRV